MYKIYSAEFRKHKETNKEYLHTADTLEEAYRWLRSHEGLPLWVWEDLLHLHHPIKYYKSMDFYLDHPEEFFEDVYNQAQRGDLPFVYWEPDDEKRYNLLKEINRKLCEEWNGRIEAVYNNRLERI